MNKRIDVTTIAPVIGTLYPSPFDQPCRARERQKLGDAAGLTQFGVNLLRLPPGAWSSQRHWHTASDEFVYVLSGEVVLVSDGGEELLRGGDAAGFKAGEPNGHCLQNRSDTDARILEIGTRIAGDTGHYSGIDMIAPAGGKPSMYTNRDGKPYENVQRGGPAP
jgi:uncharacterized cupin superfamily protein